MPKPVVREPQRLGEHPAFAVVLGEEGIESEALQLVKGDEGEDGVAQLRLLVLVDAPEAFGIKGARERLVADLVNRVVAVAEDPGEVGEIKAVEVGDDGVEEGAEAEALVGGDGPEAAPGGEAGGGRNQREPLGSETCCSTIELQHDPTEPVQQSLTAPKDQRKLS